MSSSYAVIVDKFAERHYISKFKKKHKNAWSITWAAITEQFKRIESLIGVNDIVEIITDADDIKICKTEFRIAGPGKSRHASGNRCIIAVCKSTLIVHVLLVYCKSDICEPNETAKWQTIIKDNYPEYKELFWEILCSFWCEEKQNCAVALADEEDEWGYGKDYQYLHY